MDATDLLRDLYGRVAEVGAVVGGLSEADLARRQGTGNSIAWLVWHSARVQDSSLCALTGQEQAWTAGGWAERFALDRPVDAMGYGDSSEQVDAVRAPADLLAGYHDAVADQVRAQLGRWGADDLDAVVDDSFDPPVTLATRLVSVAVDCAQHLGQAAYVRGLLTA